MAKLLSHQVRLSPRSPKGAEESGGSTGVAAVQRIAWAVAPECGEIPFLAPLFFFPPSLTCKMKNTVPQKIFHVITSDSYIVLGKAPGSYPFTELPLQTFTL